MHNSGCWIWQAGMDCTPPDDTMHVLSPLCINVLDAQSSHMENWRQSYLQCSQFSYVIDSSEVEFNHVVFRNVAQHDTMSRSV